MLNIDQEKYRFWGKYRYPISNIGMEENNIDMKYRYIERKISIYREENIDMFDISISILHHYLPRTWPQYVIMASCLHTKV